MAPVPAMVKPLLVEVVERYRRQSMQKTLAPVRRLAEYVGTLFQKQRDLLACTARKIAALCTRRAGKTYFVPAALFNAAESSPGCVVLFIARTRMRAKELAWKALLKANEDYCLGYRSNETELTLRHPSNGAEIRLRGADDKRDLEKYRGDKVAFAVVDEAQSFPDDDLYTLVEDILWPALLDVSGQLVLLGTPGYVCAGFWYSITRNEDAKSKAERAAGWVVFEWSGLDNPAVNFKGNRIADLFRAELHSLETDPAKGPTHPTVVREYRGRWVTDTRGLFYEFNPERNLYQGELPRGHQWCHVMGVDLGKKFAIEVLAYAETHPIIYEVDGFKEKNTNSNEWKRQVESYLERYQPIACVVDAGALGAAVVDAWAQEDGLPVEYADKSKRDAYVALLNGELADGKVKARMGGKLAGEWSTLPKDPDTPPGKPPQPKPGHDDHSADAALYAWRKARRLCGREDKPAPLPGTPAALKAEKEQRIQRELQRRKKWEEQW